MSSSTTGAVSEAVARVEGALAAFWSSSEGGPDKVRASTMNFVVVAPPANLDRLRGDTAALAQTRGGRVFLLTLDGRAAPWEVGSEVSGVCSKEGGEVICHDRIELTFGAMAASRAGSVVSALALSEVPTIVEAAGQAPATLVDALAKIADRVIVDSAQTSIARIAEIAKRTDAAIADRAMVRTFSWRDLVARFFDDRVAALASIESVEIARTIGPQDPAALFFGWIASRSGWTIDGARCASRTGSPIALSVRDDARADVGSGELTAVRIRLAGGDVLTCERTADPHVVRWSTSGTRSATHDYPLGFRDETWVLVKAIDATDTDKVYRQALPLAAAWSAS